MKKLISFTVCEDGCFSNVMIGDENDPIGAVGITDKLLEHKLIMYIKNKINSATDKHDVAVFNLAIDRYEKSEKMGKVLLEIEEDYKESPQVISWPQQNDFDSISQDKVLEAIYSAAECFIPFHELNDEEQERHDSIRYGLCDCLACNEASISPEKKKSMGHADLKTYQIGISREAMKTRMGLGTIQHLNMGVIPIFFLEFIYTVLHEIAHIVYLEKNEVLTDETTLRWLKSFNWEELRAYKRE